MNSKALRRLASEHANLHLQGLPPNYLWPPNASSELPDDLTLLTLLIVGPEGTPFSEGIFQLTLQIPSGYPAAAPTASFKTKIFHPNVDEKTGAVCVDTLKRDWTPETKLRDVLVVISCLLVSPNPASALNAEAGRLCESDYAAFERRARTWVSIHARVPASLKAAVTAARGEAHGQEGEKSSSANNEEESNVNTIRRGRGKRRLVGGAAEDAENGREGKRRSRSGSPSAVRTTMPLATAPENALGITDVEMDRDIGRVAAAIALPRLSQPKDMQMSPPQTTPRQASQQLRVASQGLEYPTFTTLNTTFEYKGSPQTRLEAGIMAQNLALFDDSPSSSHQHAERLKMEQQRMMAAGGDVRRYNTGAFGIRTGLFRL